jgi:hypothetical protein
MLRCRKAFRASLATASGLVAAILARAGPALASVDTSTILDANQLGLQVSNVGLIAYDPVTSSPGLEFQRGTGKFVVFSGAIWLGAKVDGVPRIAMADYSTEYTPGPMAGGTFQPDRPEFHVFKLNAYDTTGTADWMAHAVPQGAPTSGSGTKPAYLGSRTTWSAFNDANPAKHTNSGGRTAPLGVEVRQTCWASADNNLDDHVAFVSWQIRNAGAAILDSMFIGLWGDPDLGGGSDDLIGTDPALDMAYVYNADNDDFVYGSNPPALAWVLMQGPRLTPGSDPSHAWALNTFVGGDDPQTSADTYRFLKGLRRDGAAWIDPGTSLPTRFVYTGDPVAGTGWLQTNETDQRFMISCGPFTLAPGDSQEVVMAMVAAQGSNRLQSITLLRSYVTSLRQTIDVPPVPLSPSRIALAPVVSPAQGPVRVGVTAPGGASWRLEAFDVHGRRVDRIAQGTGSGAAEFATWSAAAPPGVYWIVASSDAGRATRRVVLLAR